MKHTAIIMKTQSMTNGVKQMEKMVKDAYKIYELSLLLDESSSLTKPFIMKEAKYLLSTFEQLGHANHDLRNPKSVEYVDADTANNLNSQYRALKRFIKKYAEAA
jgi:hypothetical protein